MALLDEIQRFPGALARDEMALAATRGLPAAGLADALSRPEFLVTPVSGDWTAARLRALLASLHGLDAVGVLACLSAEDLVADDTPDRALRDWLDGGIPPLWTSRRRGSRYAALDGTLTVGDRTLVSVVDEGAHLQPAEMLAHSLRDNGILLVTPIADDVAALVRSAGLLPSPWA
ncbi:hypothetical protein GCM10009754_33920 [Amycolatopsis minnesotensis]|uniref:Uncharacterized protein n=2 Tax=Amycolatopsis minnesotensis TaxID=337894 RepID=A0ABN2QZ16_9PSEU